jgi:hypothetical protein
MADETRKLSLGIKDRLTIPAFFPEKSNFLDQILKEDIEKKVKISQEEVLAVGLKYTEPDTEGRQFLTWTRANEKDLDVEFTQAEVNFLKKQVDRLDKAEALTGDLMIIAKAIRGL